MTFFRNIAFALSIVIAGTSVASAADGAKRLFSGNTAAKPAAVHTTADKEGVCDYAAWFSDPLVQANEVVPLFSQETGGYADCLGLKKNPRNGCLFIVDRRASMGGTLYAPRLNTNVAAGVWKYLAVNNCGTNNLRQSGVKIEGISADGGVLVSIPGKGTVALYGARDTGRIVKFGPGQGGDQPLWNFRSKQAS